MKIYNRSPGRMIVYWNVDDKVDAKGKPEQPLTKYVLMQNSATPDLPTKMAEQLLKEWPKKFTADKKAMEAEAATKRKLEEQGQALADHENHLLKIKSLISAAGDTKNKRAAAAAAAELDQLLARGPRPKAPEPVAAPEATAVITSEPEETPKAPPAGDFEAKA